MNLLQLFHQVTFMDGTSGDGGVLSGSWDGNNMGCWCCDDVRVGKNLWGSDDMGVSKYLRSSMDDVAVVIPAGVGKRS